MIERSTVVGAKCVSTHSAISADSRLPVADPAPLTDHQPSTDEVVNLPVGDESLELLQRRRGIRPVESADRHHRCAAGQLVARRIVRPQRRGGPRVVFGVSGQHRGQAGTRGGCGQQATGPQRPSRHDPTGPPTVSPRGAEWRPSQSSTRQAPPGTPPFPGRQPTARPPCSAGPPQAAASPPPLPRPRRLP